MSRSRTLEEARARARARAHDMAVAVLPIGAPVWLKTTGEQHTLMAVQINRQTPSRVRLLSPRLATFWCGTDEIRLSSSPDGTESTPPVHDGGA